MDTHSSAFTRYLVTFVGLSMAPALAPAAENPASTILYVATNAVHNGTGCGARERPCRSISRAIANAAAGNRIEVGPGIYGDIDGDGDANSTGEEAGVTIDKGLVVYSAGGAAQTIIKAPRSAQAGMAVVSITSNDVTFGGPGGGGGGFTIVGDKSGLGEGSMGVHVTAVGNVMIAGHVVMDHAAGGFVVDVLQPPVPGHQIFLQDNVAMRNRFGFGITVEGSASIARVHISRNLASDNDQQGFFVASTGRQSLNYNHATRNQIGFEVGGGGNSITQNLALNNAQVGIQTRGPIGPYGNNTVTDNTLIGNGIAGFRLLPESEFAELHRNNIFGNGEAATGCGLINDAGTVRAMDNYWGKADGPGPNPGDRAHGDCATHGGASPTEPFSSVPFPIIGRGSVSPF